MMDRIPLQSKIPRDTIAAAAPVSTVFPCFFFAGVKLWLNCQPGVLSWDLGHYFFGCCLVNSGGGGLFR